VSVAPRTETADDPLAAALRGFGLLGIASIALILAGNMLVAPLSAVLVLLWARLSHTPWREIGFVRPARWAASAAAGIALGVALKLLMKAVVMPLLGADPINQAFHYLVGNRAALPGALFMMIVSAGFGEETLFRGYLFERLGRLLGTDAWAKGYIVLLTSAVFGWAHYSVQGLAGVQQATMVGVVLGSIFAVSGRLFLPMVAHAAFDLTALAIIYWDLEEEVAQLVFGGRG
jgi:hypothetical protein